MARNNLPVFTIVGDVLMLPEYEAARQAQAAESQAVDWRDTLHTHIHEQLANQPFSWAPEDTSHVLSDDFLRDILAEVQGIMSDPNVTFHVFTFDENGDPVSTN